MPRICLAIAFIVFLPLAAFADVGETVHIHPHGTTGRVAWGLLAAGMIVALVVLPVVRALKGRSRK